ncbi:MAG TPA: hypothetical protein VHB79_33620 [Polyangiaceae bacterium]|nr:hypothetical protein [Polyangiaceae bacterium]
MSRGVFVTAIVVAETVFAAVCAAVFGFVVAAADAYAQGSGNMHGGVPPMTAAERAEIHAAGYWAFGVAFVVILGVELALTIGIVRLIRRDRERALLRRNETQ